MDCLELAHVYVKLDVRRNYYLRRVDRARSGVKIDKSIIKEWKKKGGVSKEAFDRIRRKMRSLQRSIRRWRYRLGTLAPLIMLIERTLSHKRTQVEKKRVDALWPNWMDQDGKLKLNQ